MEGLVFLSILIIGAFLFSFIGVIVLLVRTSRQEESIQELRRLIEKNIALNKAPNASVPAAKTAFEEEERAAVSPWTPPAEAAYIPVEAIAPDEASTADIPVAIIAPDEPERQNRLHAAVVSFIQGGNLWAAGGVILLAVGFGTLIAYLGRRGFFTVEMGIITAVVAGLAMILSGWRFRLKRPMYFMILQGGGLGIIYLSIFAANKVTTHLGIIPALVLMSLLIPPTVILALFQNSQGLAILGFFGGFAAPLILSSGEGNHLFLFSYYLILSGGVFAIGFFRAWRGLNLLAFFFTFIPSLYWVMNSYVPEFFPGSEPFFLVYIFLFTFLGLRSLKNQDYRFQHYSDIILILGTPAAAAAIQWKIFSFVEHGYAVIAVIFSAFYLALTVLVLKKGNRAMRGYAEGYLALGTLLANIVIPLELSPGITGALWAAEGALVFFFGFRMTSRGWKGEILEGGNGDIRIKTAGIVVHAAAATAFIRDISLARTNPASWRSPGFTGSLIIAVSALIMAVMAEKLGAQKKEKQNPLSLCAVLWGFAWWFGGWYFEFRRVLPAPADAFLILASLSAFLSWLALNFFGLKIFLAGMVPATLAAAFAVLKVYANISIYSGLNFTHNFFDPSGFRGWLAFFVFQGLTILFHRPATAAETAQGEKIGGSEPAWFRDTRIFIVILTAMAVLSASGRFYTKEYGLSISWTSLAGLLPLFAALIILPFRKGNRQWGKLLFPGLPVLLSGILGLWFIVTLFHTGNPSPLHCYVPLINPLDLLEGLCIVSILFWQIKDKEKQLVLSRTGCIVLGDILLFIWIVSMLARSVHFYAGIPWRNVVGSDAFQLCLFIFWALYGIFHIIMGHRKKMRVPWIAGAVLIAVDIGKLILIDMRGISTIPRILSFFAAGLILLFIGWAAPLPPPLREKHWLQ